MKIPHLTVLPLIFFAAFAAAQIAPASAGFEPVQPVPAVHFDPKHPCASPVICDSFGASSKPLPAFTFKQFEVPPQNAKPYLLSSSTIVLPPGFNTIPETCYTVRAYEYSATNVDIDRLTRTGATTCQPASNFHMKSALLTVSR